MPRLNHSLKFSVILVMLRVVCPQLRNKLLELALRFLWILRGSQGYISVAEDKRFLSVETAAILRLQGRKEERKEKSGFGIIHYNLFLLGKCLWHKEETLFEADQCAGQRLEGGTAVPVLT